ncbi:MAG: trigger factor [Pelagibacteraceae bacterium]|jgi:trigger factor|nr:trigger factor [Pelagibacteraceae bacterium]|tara:strand:+ start:87 stop:1520 length:1434 start_codon:yes stop_codon:yes gene_type:complete
MKVKIENKKGLNKNLKVFVDKKTIETHMNEKYEEVKKQVALKGFRPGKVPKEILKRQFGKSIYGEVLDKVLKETSTQALEDNKIKPAGQPKIDLKSHGEDKDLEYVISVTELPKIELKPIENIKIDEYSVKIDDEETDKRIKEIAKNQKNFVAKKDEESSEVEDLVAFDYKATIEGKFFTGGEGKNTQIVLGKDLFIKGFDKELTGVKKNETKTFEVVLPENYPQKEFANKKAKFECKILEVKKSIAAKIDEDFAKNLGAKDLNDLKILISRQINDEYKNSLNMLSKNKILEQIKKFKVDEIPENLIEQEINILSQDMKDNEINKNKKDIEKKAKDRIKLGLILNAFGEQNKIQVHENEIQAEIQKQLKMMPGQEKIVMDYYQKNPSASDALRGTIYEEKIIELIKSKSKVNKKEISKDEAEKILKSAHDHLHDHKHTDSSERSKVEKTVPVKKSSQAKKVKPSSKKPEKIKKVSKK